MNDPYSITEQLIEAFARDYFGKLFYFCLKRTGSTDEAEELTAEVSLQILAALRNGTVPDHFSAWVWQIARNCYSGWAERKRRRSETVSGTDLADFDDIATEDNMEERFLLSEDLKLLRRELAFISSDYRNVVVAFYIEDRKVSDIARSLQLSEGTVKSKLFRSRQILKEGMKMAREFGSRSYKPEHIRFVASGAQPSGLPWKVVQRQIPKNILLEANNNPSTLEELSVELGIALPYMEEEVGILKDATLLKQAGNKFVTNFFIQDKEFQYTVYKTLRSDSKKRSELLDKIITDSLPSILALNIVHSGISDGELKWWLLPHTIDMINSELDGSYDFYKPKKRDNGEKWGFVGYEQTELPEKLMMGHNGCGNGTNMFWAYKIDDYDLWDRMGEMSFSQTLLLSDMIRNNRKPTDLSDTEISTWEEINGRYAHTDNDGNVIADIIVLRGDTLAQINGCLKAHPLFESVKKRFQNAFNELISLYKANSNPILHDDLPYYASIDMCNMRMMTVHDEVDAERLTVPADPDHSTIAMCLVLH